MNFESSFIDCSAFLCIWFASSFPKSVYFSFYPLPMGFHRVSFLFWCPIFHFSFYRLYFCYQGKPEIPKIFYVFPTSFLSLHLSLWFILSRFYIRYEIQIEAHLFFCLCRSSCFSLVYWKGWPSSIELLLHFGQNQLGILVYLFCSIELCVSPSANIALSWLL